MTVFRAFLAGILNRGDAAERVEEVVGSAGGRKAKRAEGVKVLAGG